MVKLFIRFPQALKGISISVVFMLFTSSWAHGEPEVKSFSEMINKITLIPSDETGSEMLQKAKKAVEHLKRMELIEASKAINEALQLDARNSYLHFLNGFIYHLQARQGNAERNEVAIEGYRQALRLDPGNWIAQEFLGLAYLDLKQFKQAKEHFSEALLMSPDSTISIYGLMVSSYMTADPITACVMADQFSKASSDLRPGFIRSSIFVYASCGNFEKADQMRSVLSKLSHYERADVERVDYRLAQWKSFYQKWGQSNSVANTSKTSGFIHAKLDNSSMGSSLTQLALASKTEDNDADEDKPSVASKAVTTAQSEPKKISKSEEAKVEAKADAKSDTKIDGIPRMVLVDVVMVRTEELITTARGINLLNALALQLGSATAPAYSNNYTNNPSNGISTIITSAITVPALTYSLNIANASNASDEVLARPTLAAIEGQSSEFFSGTNLNAGVVSTSNLGAQSITPIDKRFGVKLAVTPNFLPNGMVKLKVDALRTFLNAGVDSTGFSYRLEISETSANANVVMKIGDTLVLSGLSEKEASSSRTGVPLLQDIPVAQYFFSNKRTSDFQRSVLILITPRLPVFTSQLEHHPDGTVTDSMKALREKFGFSGTTPPNIKSIMNHFKTTALFREFRQGDVSLERWDRLGSTGDRLRQALDFLYY